MSDERPEALLKSALEKIIYFEARSEQLCTDLRQSREEAERLRRELSAAAQREISLRAQVAELEVYVARTGNQQRLHVRLNDALRRERNELIGKMLEASRLHSSGNEEAGEPELEFDLASFIAELRGEVLGLREAPAVAVLESSALAHHASAPAVAVLDTGAPAHHASALAVATATAPGHGAVRGGRGSGAVSMARHAERFRAQGRLDVSAEELHALAREPMVEETLFGFSVRELSSAEPGARIRAAGRLRSLAIGAAAPALATALNAEQEPLVLVALLEAFVPVAGPEGAAVVVPHLRSPVADVRIGALRALLRVDPVQAAPHLSAAMKDPDRAVRRRASLLALALSGEEALKLGEEAGRDADPKVRALGALALGAAGGTQARAALTALLQDSDTSVRQAASRSLSSILGTDVSAVVSLDDAQRRREIRRLSALPSHPVTAVKPEPALALAPPPAAAMAESPQPSALPADEALCASVLGELRISIRGRTAPDMAQTLGASLERVEEACALVSARGQAVRRGFKYFVA